MGELISLISENLATSNEKREYVGSSFFRKCEEAISGTGLPESAGVSRRLAQGHLMLRILLHHFQRPSTLANMTHDDFSSAQLQANKDRVVQV